MVTLVRLVAVVAAALAPGCSGTQAHEGGCSKDTDCRDPRVCERGACVDPHPIARGTSDPTSDGGPATDVVSDVAVKGSPAFAMFGGDARHTGRRGGPAPTAAPKELWSVDVKGVVAGSPTIGPDGTIYVSSHDGNLYAISDAGQIKWAF